MQPLKIDHIGIAVFDLEESTEKYVAAMAAEILEEEKVEAQGVIVRFLKVGDCIYELLQPLDNESAVARFLAKRGEGVHHVAFRTDDIKAEYIRCQEKGLHLLQGEPVAGARNKMIFFIHPKDMGGILTEICQPRHD